MQKAPVKLCRYCVGVGKCQTSNTPPSPISMFQDDPMDHAMFSVLPFYASLFYWVAANDSVSQTPLTVGAVSSVSLFCALRYRVAQKKKKGTATITFDRWLARDRACTVINDPMTLYLTGETTEVPKEYAEMKRLFMEGPKTKD